MTHRKYDAHLAAVVALQSGATPSERPYLARLRARYEHMNAVDPLSEEGEPEETPEDLRASLNEGYEGLYWYRAELENPNTDAYWSEFLKTQIAKYEELLETMVADFREQGHEYQPPPLDVQQLTQNEELKTLESELAGLQQLQAVTLAWAERHDTLPDTGLVLDDLNAKIEILQDKLDSRN